MIYEAIESVELDCWLVVKGEQIVIGALNRHDAESLRDQMNRELEAHEIRT